MRKIIIITVIWVSACTQINESKSPYVDQQFKKLTQVITVKNSYVFGDTIEFESKSKDITIDSLKASFYGKTLAVGKKIIRINSKLLFVGHPKVMVTTYFQGKTENHYPNFSIFSNKNASSAGYKIVREYPHNTASYTQGLFFDGKILVESTGQNGYSKLQKIDFPTMRVITETNLDNEHFGEGATEYEDKYYQITWRTHTCFVYDSQLQLIEKFQFYTEGWGLTTMGDTLLLSDGSDNIYWISPDDFRELGRFQVMDGTKPIDRINELEYHSGKLYANIYLSDSIAVIDPKNGIVNRWINLSGLLSENEKRNAKIDVLNGIAIHPDNQHLMVTGKWWPKLFEIEIQK